ncbi:ABC-type multidrug transport system fused ATPase/permease subunit [Methanomicrobium sp. W14]|uniref:ABC transporter ATP-binding protein n=1 Tax=Methanomicrobium sp. W14 TaxID=2817839 RepID=UPI001AE8A22E|nr:ABC transporter ATP-binding protein [Methanomicrobium sp. W14]MBP2134572.1 ABC-type multidrug transport system fused ATPase/permease subunit [Methanomicrobium sp. W14]
MSVISDSVKIMNYLFSPFKKMLLIYLLGVILLSFLEVFRISLVYPIINYGLGVENQPKLLDAFYDYLLPSSVNPFIAAAFLLLITTVVIAVIYSVVVYGGSYLFSTVRDSLDRRVFERIQSRPYSYFAGKKQGDLLYIGQGAVMDSSQAINQFVEFIRNSLMAFLYLLLLFYLSFWLTIGVIILGIFYALVVKKYLFSRVYRNSNVLNESLKDKSVVYQEFISGIKTILITGSLKSWHKKYDSAIKRLKKAYTNVYALGKIPLIANDFIMFSIIALGGIFLYLYTGGNFISYIGIFGTFMLGLYRLVPSLSYAQTNMSLLVQYLPALEMLYNILTEESFEDSVDFHEKSDKKRFSFENTIEFRDISFRFKDNMSDTICNLSLDIQKNTKIAIVGSSGSGKTTTANLLALLYKPSSGGIFIDGVNLNEINTSDYLRNLGYIGQETFVYHDTVKENIKFGLECSDEEIVNAAKLADAHEFIMNTKDGYDTVIGDQGIKLSGGQRQRIAIARIILRKPQILLLDEATSSLDNLSEQKIMESVEKLSKNMTVIIIAHRLSTVQNADSIYVLKGGKLVEKGTHLELLEQNGEYRRLYLGQKKGYN